MKTYTLKENVISVMLGAVIATILIVIGYRYDNPPSQPVETQPVEIIKEDVKEVPFKIEIPTIVQEEPETVIEPETTTEPEIERIALGEFRVTAYCACEICCPGTSDGITFTETIATEGRTIAVDPEVIPLGSIVEVNGKEYIAEDIGGSIKENSVDIYFNSHEDALIWGVQYHDVYLIEE